MGDHADDLMHQEIMKHLKADEGPLRDFLIGKSKRQTWTTIKGETLYIDEMEISHIKNCIEMCVRRGLKAPSLMYERVEKETKQFFDKG